MMGKIIYWLGLFACIALVISCFIPWAYFADVNIPLELDRTFTGFFSYKDNYGKPGKFFVFFAIVIFTFMILPKVWAKRINLFLSAFTVAYGVKSYILYTSCYNALCPQKLFGIYLMLISTIFILLASFFPNMKVPVKQLK